MPNIQLNEHYQAHKDIVFEMIKNAELYPESRLKELQDIFSLYGILFYACFCRDEGNQTYGFLLKQEHNNLTSLSHKLFLNVKILKKL